MLKDLTQEDKFIQDGLNAIDEEVKTEDEIKDQAQHITQLLTVNPVVRVEFAGSVYTLSQKMADDPQRHFDKDGNAKVIKVKCIILVAINENKRRQAYLANKAYLSPAVYKGEYNDEFTLKENLFAVVEAFLRHVTGDIKIESEDDGIAKVAREKDMIK